MNYSYCYTPMYGYLSQGPTRTTTEPITDIVITSPGPHGQILATANTGELMTVSDIYGATLRRRLEIQGPHTGLRIMQGIRQDQPVLISYTKGTGTPQQRRVNHHRFFSFLPSDTNSTSLLFSIEPGI